MKPCVTAFAAIRRDATGREFVSLPTISPDRPGTVDHIRDFQIHLPAWHRDNPVQRIARIRIEEISA